MTPIRRLIAASGLTNLGDGFTVLAWAWVASVLTRDALFIALVPVAVRLPWLLGALPAGLMADRYDRRLLVAGADALRVLAFGAVAFLLWHAGPLPEAPPDGLSRPDLMAVLLVAATFVGFAEVLRDSAAAALLPSLVNDAQLERANGRLWSVELVGNALLGPALGAFLLAVSFAAPFASAAGLYLAGGLIVLGLAAPPRRAAQRRHWRAELGEGLDVLRGQPFLRQLVWITAVWNLLAEMALIALILHGQENLGMGAPAYGLVLAAGALGGVFGGWAGEHVVRRLGPGRIAQLGSLGAVPAFVLLAYAPGPVAAGAAFFFFNFMGLLWNTVSTAYRQRRVPDDKRGRVNAIYRMASWGAAPLGIFLSGVVVRLAESVLDRPVALIVPILIAAVGIGLLTLAIWRRLHAGFGAKP